MLQRVDADGSGNIDFAEFSKQAALKLQLVAQGLRKESEEETAEKFFEPQGAGQSLITYPSQQVFFRLH